MNGHLEISFPRSVSLFCRWLWFGAKYAVPILYFMNLVTPVVETVVAAPVTTATVAAPAPNVHLLDLVTVMIVISAVLPNPCRSATPAT